MDKKDIIITAISVVAVAILIYIIIKIFSPSPPNPPSSGWTIYQNKTGGTNLDFVPGNVDTIKKACLQNSSCAGFTSDGTLLESIPNPVFLTNSQYDLYIQTPPAPPGYQIYPKTTSGQNYNIVGGGTPPYIASQCEGLGEGLCSGFLSDGTIVNGLTNPSYFTPGQYDLYVRNTVVPKGYKLYPKSTSGSNYNFVGGGMPNWLAQNCTGSGGGCGGFTSDGMLLSNLSDPSQFKPSQYDLYVKS